MTTQPTKGEPVAGTATPQTDALIAARKAKGFRFSFKDEFDSHRDLETKLTLASEKIAVQEEIITAFDAAITKEFSVGGKRSEDGDILDDFAAWIDHHAKLEQERDTARASLADVMEKMEAIAHEVGNAETRQHHVLVATLRSIITQEEGKPTL